MAMRNYFLVLFVIVVKKFSGKKNRDNYKGSRKIPTNLKNYNFSLDHN
jgi:hypothetical protein